jgi:ABC-type multidrug transport system ATPase subunit
MPTVLTATGLRKSYGNREVLRGIDLSLNRGSVTGLIGRNGVGKTTLLRILGGLIRSDGGAMTVDGRAVPPLGPRPGVAFFGGGQTIPPGISAPRWARYVSGGTYRFSEKRAVRDLSRGTRQMLGLRATLAATDSRVILLDEPWEGLDPDGARWLNVELARRSAAGDAVLVSSHRLDDLARASRRYLFLADGVLRESEKERFGSRTGGEDLLREFDRWKGVP